MTKGQESDAKNMYPEFRCGIVVECGLERSKKASRWM